MAEKPIEGAILDEARGAHAASREILGLMQAPSEGDPILEILALLRSLQLGQRTILARLEAIEKRAAPRG